MLLSHFRFAWRNLVKDRQFTILNLAGLATGLACALLIWLWISDERNMDKFNDQDARIYQVMQNLEQPEGIMTMEYTSGLLANALAEQLPGVEYATTVVPASWFSSKGIISMDENRLKARGQFISKDYFKIFSIRFLSGNSEHLFSDKNAIAISDELAMKLFQSTNVLGKILEWSQNEFNGTYVIKGVFEKNPDNVFDKFDVLFNFDKFVERRPGMLEWGNSDPNTYLLLKEGTNIEQFNDRIRNFMLPKDKHEKKTLFVRKFSDKYLFGQYINGVQSGGRIAYIRLFATIGIFILLIACINFMNLSTARASKRIREVGVKKAVGAGRGRLIIEYLSESVCLSFCALLLALVLVVLLLPAFNALTGKTLALHFTPFIFSSAIVITLITGLVAGVYPALYISGFKPVKVLKGMLNTSAGELWVRKGLVVFQFSLAVMAIVAVLIISAQMNYIQSKDLGYKRDNVVSFPIPLEEDQQSKAIVFVNKLKNIPGVLNASSYYHNLTGEHGSIGGFEWPRKDPNNQIDFGNLEVGNGFMETMGIEIIEGKGFSNNDNAQQEIIFNEEAIRKMGLKDPIGKMVKFWDRKRQIVGIAKDFNFESLYQTVKPCFFQIYPVLPNIAVKVKAGTEKQTLSAIEKEYTAFYKGLSFDYKFLDEEYQALYAAETKVSILSRYMTVLIILISCLGLFGLAAFTAQRRQKEIGIRKVVGASAGNIVMMLSKDFVKLILIAIVIACPLVGWAMHQWLQEFAYRISISPYAFVVAGIAVVAITLFTISFQALKAARANPVESLRTE